MFAQWLVDVLFSLPMNCSVYDYGNGIYTPRLIVHLYSRDLVPALD